MPERLTNRKDTRLKGWDYSSTGRYFITVCTKNRKTILGEMVGDDEDDPKVKLSSIGKIVENTINSTNNSYNNAQVDMYIIMPNHIHLIIQIEERPPRATATTASIPTIIATFKTLTVKQSGEKLW